MQTNYRYDSSTKKNGKKIIISRCGYRSEYSSSLIFFSDIDLRYLLILVKSNSVIGGPSEIHPTKIL